MPHNVIEGCFHEQEWGEYKAEKRRWEAHMVNTVETLDALKQDINEIKLLIQAQTAALNASIAALTQVGCDIRRDLDKTATKLARHVEDHCAACKNEKSLFDYATKCETVTDDFTAMKQEIEILYPMARALRMMRDKMWLIILSVVCVVVVANLLGIEAGIIFDRLRGK